MQAMRSTMLPVLLEHARRHGASADALAARFDVPLPARAIATWSLELPAFSTDALVDLADAVAKALEDDSLGLHMAAEVPRGTYGVQEFALRNAPTLGDAARRLARYQRLTNDTLYNDTDCGDDESWVGHRVPGRPRGLGPHLDVFLLALTLRFMRDLGGPDITPRRVELAPLEVAAPRGELVTHFDCDRLVLGAGRSAMVFEREVWERPVRDADPALLPILDAYAQERMPEEPEQGWRGRVREHLRRNLSDGPTIEGCAAALGVPVRTLQRRLREETSASYREVVDAYREERARQLMANTALPIDEVSFLLGFSARRSFARAFERWTGETPGAFRAARGG